MGFLDNFGGLGKIAGSLAGLAGGGAGKDHGIALLLVKGLVEKHGGFGGLMEKFSGAGLGHVVESWMGQGENLPVSSDQILDTLGHEEVDEVSKNLDMDKTKAADLLSQFLPEIADKASTKGVMGMLDNFDTKDIPNLLGKLLK